MMNWEGLGRKRRGRTKFHPEILPEDFEENHETSQP
jgi:hypothetical protein